jgi:hypothetical protein
MSFRFETCYCGCAESAKAAVRACAVERDGWKAAAEEVAADRDKWKNACGDWTARAESYRASADSEHRLATRLEKERDEAIRRGVNLHEKLMRAEAERDAARDNVLKMMRERDEALLKLAEVKKLSGTFCRNCHPLAELREIVGDPLTSKLACLGCGGLGRVADHPCPACQS